MSSNVLSAEQELALEARRVAWGRSQQAAVVALDPRWQPPETAPKDRQILANVGWPWPTVALWSEYADSWVVAEVQWSVCAGRADPSFVTEHELTLVGWMELPEVKCAER